jgi:hypothetical protein
MTTPAFYPPARILVSIDRTGEIPLRKLIERAGLSCRASGSWAERGIVLMPGRDDILREPGSAGRVAIGVPAAASPRAQARHAVAALAYGVMDVVARESIRGAAWARVKTPPGRPRRGLAKSTAQRQREYRSRQRG